MVVVSLGGCRPLVLPCDKLALNIAVLVPRISQTIETIEKSSQEETRNVSSSADTKLD